ncbi:NAD-dependent succinate-semialdehyde dehydrogenase [Glutamicibacter sp.]|uniref:NAD-dependent succinate-semialdehyde dehydrogenase n=1 Tax=Glutamicibacter sp. TaxID=1931995 RepID=UPI002FE0BDC8
MSNEIWKTISGNEGEIELPLGLYIDGEWRAAQGGKVFSVQNPADETAIAAVADAGNEDSLEALSAATAAQGAWGKTTARHRSNILRSVYELLKERKEEIAWVMSLEMGKPLAEARGEVQISADYFQWFSEVVTQQQGTYTESPSGGFKIITTHQPVGPSYLVTPWNFPLFMGARKAAAALAAGCAIIIKPAALTPLVTHMFVQVLHEVGLPRGVVNLVTTSSSSAQSKVLMSRPELKKVSFTGSTAVGVTLLKQAADNVMATSMELGGNGPFVVLSDADLDAAAEGAVVAKFRNAGQVCVAANRIIVEKSVAAAFKERFVAKVAELRVGSGTDAAVNIGPLVDEKQRRSVQQLLGRAVEEGAEILFGGGVFEGPGFFVNPTVVTNASTDSAIATSEIFGPVASIYEVEGDEAALDLANQTPFGLVSYVYTRDVGQALKAAEKLDSGMVAVNRAVVADPAAPFGGIKASGFGKEGGHAGIKEYQIEKYIALSM